jgi:hypothetical protein
VAGVPEYHALRTDAADQLAAVDEFLGRFDRRFRVLSRREADWLNVPRSHACCVPDLRPLHRAATVGDIGSGDAVFHLAGKGLPVVVELPMWVLLNDGTRGLVVQAEAAPDGTLVYGVVFRHGMAAVAAADILRSMAVELD